MVLKYQHIIPRVSNHGMPRMTYMPPPGGPQYHVSALKQRGMSKQAPLTIDEGIGVDAAFGNAR